MASIADIRQARVADLTPYAKNARTHSETQVQQIADSIKAFGFLTPVLIDGAGNLIAGHGRVLAAKLLGMETVPAVLIEGLTEEQRRAYILADNRLTELGGWDEQLVQDELAALSFAGFDVALTGFDFEPEETDEYAGFVEKFSPKLTTDDCYTPPAVYEAVRSWAVKEYELEGPEIVRPFYPGGDYQRYDYPEGCAVIDNPPFSILSEIVRWYMDKGIRFFLFAPGLTLFSIAGGECNYIPTAINVVFENGADIQISFVTDMGDYKIDTAPELYAAVAAANALSCPSAAELPKYRYPDTVLLPNSLASVSKNGGRVRIRRAAFVRALDSQKADGKAMYGAGFLISQKDAEKAAAEKAAAEKAAAEKAAAEKAAFVWQLSERELAIIADLEGDE